MALAIVYTNNFIELSLDGATDFDVVADLVGLGMPKNAPNGLRIKKITFIPSAVGDTLIVRDGQKGPRMFSAMNVLGIYDALESMYSGDGKIDRGKSMSPFIDASECTIGVANQAFVIFEL